MDEETCNHNAFLVSLGNYACAPLDDGHFTSFFVVKCQRCGRLTGIPEDNYSKAKEYGTLEVRQKLQELEASNE